jgi:DNA-binding MarR family transcriptional regulator
MQLVREPLSDDALDALGEAVRALVRATKNASRHPAHAAFPAMELAALLADGERRLGDLAVLRGVGQSVVSRQIGELEARGLVVRRPDPADGRAGLVRLTPAGHALLDDVAASRRRWLDEALGSLPETDVRAATRLLTALAGQFHRHFALEVLEEGHQA